jgi:acyl-CoA synthetase (AMP-forming)/AMP-acid ligase II
MQYPALPPIPSIFSLIQFQARLNPHARAFVSERRIVTYRTFVEHVENVTKRLAAVGLPASSRVAVAVKATYLKWLVNISVMRLGLLSADGSSAGEIALVQPDTIVTDGSATSTSARIVTLGVDWLTDPGGPPFREEMHPRDAPCRIVLSSGTTGTPKRILLTFGALQARHRVNIGIYGTNADSRVLSVMGASTIGGLTTPLFVWAAGGSVIFPGKLSPERPLWEALLLQPTSMMLSPGHLQQLVDELPADFSPMRQLAVLVGGSSLATRLSVKARARLTHQLYVVYGSTEAGTVALAPASHADARPGFTGYVAPFATVEIVDEDGRALPPGTEGEVRLRTDVLIDGYMDADANETGLRDGWFYPGDTGMLDEAGGLTVTGRTRELINIGGLKLSPAIADDVLSGLPGVKDVAVVGIETPRGVMPCAAVVAGEDFDGKALTEAFRAKFRRAPPPVIAKVASIPRNEMGKVMRQSLAESLQERLKKEAVPPA